VVGYFVERVGPWISTYCYIAISSRWCASIALSGAPPKFSAYFASP
jgi:hypothetical protein